MSLRTWLNSFVVAGALAFTAPPSPASAQQPEPPVGTLPRLPETEVVAEPEAPQLTPNFEPFARPQNVVQSNAFQAPPAEGYFAQGSTAGSVIAIPNLRFPGTVNTVTEDMIRDQQALSFSDILRDIGGAVQTNGDNLRPDQFFLRGLEMTSYNFRKNGVLDPTYTPREFANVVRVDILKGPGVSISTESARAHRSTSASNSAQRSKAAAASVNHLDKVPETFATAILGPYGCKPTIGLPPCERGPCLFVLNVCKDRIPQRTALHHGRNQVLQKFAQSLKTPNARRFRRHCDPWPETNSNVPVVVKARGGGHWRRCTEFAPATVPS